VWVCLCEAVTSGTIVDAIEAGARTVADVEKACGAGSVCGKCRRNILILIDQHQGDAPPARKGWPWRRMRTS
jgi:bacterioferritin-associated ferredoxin